MFESTFIQYKTFNIIKQIKDKNIIVLRVNKVLHPAIWAIFGIPPVKNCFGDSPLSLEDYLVLNPHDI
jgi:hypothetical protein